MKRYAYITPKTYKKYKCYIHPSFGNHEPIELYFIGGQWYLETDNGEFAIFVGVETYEEINNEK